MRASFGNWPVLLLVCLRSLIDNILVINLKIFLNKIVCSQIKPVEYMELISSMRPNIWATLADEVPTWVSDKRNRTSVDRTVRWLDDCIALSPVRTIHVFPPYLDIMSYCIKMFLSYQLLVNIHCLRFQMKFD